MKKEIQTILKTRAALMAREDEQKKKASSIVEIIRFTLATETYGIESAYVREVYPLKEFTPLPGVPAFIFGIINVRGQIIAIVDLKKFFNLPERGIGELNRVIIIGSEQMEFGILADLVEGTQQVFDEEILAAPSTVTSIGANYLRGVTNDRLVILDASKLLSDKSILVNVEAD
jgi:purine-binding chemotaxis protein CheW